MSTPIIVGPADGIEPGEAKVVDADDTGTGSDIAVFHDEDGRFYALDDECTHETASLADGWIEDGEVECPSHSARFSLKTGEALSLPANAGAQTHRVEVRDGQILLYPADSACSK